MRGFSRKNFDYLLKHWLTKAICKLAAVKLILGGLLCFFAPPVGMMFAMAGVMTGGIAGVVRLTPTQLRFACGQQRPLNGLALRRVPPRTNDRSKRTASRQASISRDGDGSESGEPDLSIFIYLPFLSLNSLKFFVKHNNNSSLQVLLTETSNRCHAYGLFVLGVTP